ncbi:MAG: hypothetical protein SO112_02575 [Treponema sp.]|nr:hypothetical protein [Treponema sp.]
MKTKISIFFYVFIFSISIYSQSLDNYQRYRFVGEPQYKEEYRKAIYNCLLSTSKYICDVNNDGTTNCQDWTLVFYKLWHQKYDNEGIVEMALNVNPRTGMNHMFIAIKYSPLSDWEYIEPQAFENGNCNRSYFMEDYWPKKYNPFFNEIKTDYLYKNYFLNKLK